MKYLTDTISVTLAEKLKEKGMPMEYDMNWTEEVFKTNKIKLVCPTYAEVFDWLMSPERNLRLYVIKQANTVADAWHYQINNIRDHASWVYYGTWHEAANAAIEKALTLI